jgi:hypothetical protein
MYWEPLSDEHDWLAMTLSLLQKGSQELPPSLLHPNLPVKKSANQSYCVFKMKFLPHAVK